jgi:hypothetical protein
MHKNPDLAGKTHLMIISAIDTYVYTDISSLIYFYRHIVVDTTA